MTASFEQEIKAMAGDLRAPLEIEQLQPLAERDVIERFEVEFRQRGLSFADLQVCLIVGAGRRVGMRHVGNRTMDHVEIGADALQLGLRGGSLLAQLASLILARFTLGRVFGLADRFRDFVGLPIEMIDLGLLIAPLSFQVPGSGRCRPSRRARHSFFSPGRRSRR